MRKQKLSYIECGNGERGKIYNLVVSCDRCHSHGRENAETFTTRGNTTLTKDAGGRGWMLLQKGRRAFEDVCHLCVADDGLLPEPAKEVEKRQQELWDSVPTSKELPDTDWS